MARTDVIVLGGGIVGTSIALQLVKRGMSVALIERGRPGEETSYGNAGVIEGSTIMPPAFPSDFGALLRVALKQASDANYHMSFLPWVAPWLLKFRAYSQPQAIEKTARINRPFFAQAIPEHEELMLQSGATQLLRCNGWIKLYRNDAAITGMKREFELAREFNVPVEVLDPDGVRKLEPSINPTFKHAVYWPAAVSLSDPLALTQAYAARFAALGGFTFKGDALRLHRSGSNWRVETDEGPIDAPEVIVALGPWAPDLLKNFGIRLPMGFKRGYHRHFKTEESAPLSRPVVDVHYGYLITPMRQGIRLTTGAEFAPRDAAATPAQIDRLMPKLKELYRIGSPAEDRTWLGARPCFPDSRPVIGRAPGQKGMWLAVGHAHWGLTLGPVTGRLLGEMMSGETPFVDPKGFAAERFL
ncbi:NAD(P)/FAD-dependent oxidoreductase [Undibacter mobilis]|uniref:FAD-binding oxidoreductase n=1 Tax=Undibacter mobilis TaxID=2292256 RepID=A0A371BCM7_9BRAD|nr:FAD-binding oxidoreductase [Undibacter mobilis]RDV05267.1 FAD-binding oxidoreductase [Undibacter mobilis]